jgi:nucleoside-diphosphate-sugar epimerase
VFEIDGGTTIVQHSLERLGELQCEPSLLLHLAFLTKDKVAGMDADAYVAANRALSATVLSALGPIGVDRLFVASSGAAAYADRADAPADLRLYGTLKREDEERFANWAMTERDHRRTAIVRIYAVSGPYMNKHETYALASFIKMALAGGPIVVRAPCEVFRAYVAIRELVSLVFAILLAGEAPAVVQVDSGGEPLELEVVARIVARLAGGVAIERAMISETAADRYFSDGAAYARLLAEHDVPSLPIAEQLAETIAWFRRPDSHATVHAMPDG